MTDFGLKRKLDALKMSAKMHCEEINTIKA